MSIQPDTWIKEMAIEHKMIEPFEEKQIRNLSSNKKVVSYGLSSYGYDIRVADEFKVFSNVHNSIVKAKHYITKLK